MIELYDANRTEGTIQTLTFEGSDVRIILREGEPWWMLADVCRVLEIANSRDAAQRLDDDLKLQVSLGVGSTDTPLTRANFISEPGLYQLVMTSRKPEAKKFRRWAADRIVEIRRTGSSVDPRIASHPSVIAGKAALDAIATAVRAEMAAQEALNRTLRLEAAVGDLDDSFTTVLGWFNLQHGTVTEEDASVIGKLAAKICRDRGIAPGSAKHKRWGRVNTYPESVIAEAHEWFSRRAM